MEGFLCEFPMKRLRQAGALFSFITLIISLYQTNLNETLVYHVCPLSSLFWLVANVKPSVSSAQFHPQPKYAESSHLLSVDVTLWSEIQKQQILSSLSTIPKRALFSLGLIQVIALSLSHRNRNSSCSSLFSSLLQNISLWRFFYQRRFLPLCLVIIPEWSRHIQGISRLGNNRITI